MQPDADKDEVIKRQQSEIEEQKKRIAELENLVEQQQKENEELKRALEDLKKP